jgi:hypothetical protein
MTIINSDVFDINREMEYIETKKWSKGVREKTASFKNFRKEMEERIESFLMKFLFYLYTLCTSITSFNLSILLLTFINFIHFINSRIKLKNKAKQSWRIKP